MKVLFICNQNQNRSKTAEVIFKDRFETRSARLFNEYPVTISDIDWADLVVVMEDFQRTELSNRFPRQYMNKRILSMQILDVYNYYEDDLIKILEKNYLELIEPLIVPV
jgi:predicted protein tyrosine phosphatase